MNGVYALLTVAISFGVYAIMGWFNFRYAESYADENYRISHYRNTIKGKKVKEQLEEGSRYRDWKKKCENKIRFYWTFSAIYAIFIHYGIIINNKYWIYVWGMIFFGILVGFVITVMGWIITDFLIQRYINCYDESPQIAIWQEEIKNHLFNNRHIVIMICSPVISFAIFAMGAIIMMLLNPNLPISLIGTLLLSNIVSVIPVKIAMRDFVKDDFIMQINPFKEILLNK